MAITFIARACRLLTHSRLCEHPAGLFLCCCCSFLLCLALSPLPLSSFFSSHYFHSKNALLSPFLFLSSPLTLGLLLHCDVLCLCTSLTGASAAVSSCYIMLMLYVSWRMSAPAWNGDVREHVRVEAEPNRSTLAQRQAKVPLTWYIILTIKLYGSIKKQVSHVITDLLSHA